MSQTHRHVSLALWSYRNAFVVWRVGVRLGSHTSLNPGTGLYKDEGCEMVISFVYILFTPRFLFCRHFTCSSHSKLICNEMATMEEVLLLHFGMKNFYHVCGHLQGWRGQVTVLGCLGCWQAITSSFCTLLCLVFEYLHGLKE